MSIASRITSIEEHIGDTYDVLELGGFNPYLLPKEYTQLEYIESTGTQYIDTGIVPTKNTKMNFDFRLLENTNGWSCLLGSRSDNDSMYCIYMNDVLLTTNYGNIDVGISSNVSINTTDIFNIKNDGYKFYINNQFETSISPSIATFEEETQTPQSIFIFANNSYGTPQVRGIKARVYKLQLYENDVLVSNLIPCIRKSDNEVGMYDLVRNVFLTNQGTGTFTAGAENRQKVVNKNLVNIAPSIKQKYLDYMNNGTQEIWNNWEKVTGTGSDLKLNNTVQAPMNIVVGGNSEQVQYSGKNLAKVSGDSITLFQNLVVNKNGNDITISGTATGDITSGKAFSIDGNSHTNYASYLSSANTFTLKAGTYTLSINNISGSYSGINRLDIVLLKKTENTPYRVLKLFSLPTIKDTVTISEDIEECFIAIAISYTQETAITFSNYKFNIMLASGTDDTYEPYVRSEQPHQIHLIHKI